MSFISFCLSFRCITEFCIVTIDGHLFTILYLSCSGTQNALSSSSLIAIFSAILTALKTLTNDEGTQHTV